MGVSQVILQLGDLHYPEFAQANTAVDLHDKTAPGALDSQLKLPVPAAIRRAVIDEIKAAPDALIAICGDTTSKGDKDGFVAGVEYLKAILTDPAIQPAIVPDRVHFVPGNHDVAFKGDAPFVGFEDLERFEDLATIVTNLGLPTVFTTSHRATRITNSSGGSLSVLSVNTCRGAGATRSAATQRAEAAGYVGADGGGPEPARVGRQNLSHGADEVLDVPLLHPHELTAISTEWAHPPADMLPVLLAHHGLLPQHTPRLNPYTEMVNGGQARKAIANIHHPVLYLHGHIHEHVVEVIESPKYGDQVAAHDRTVVVAAPELKDGFNKILVHFTEEGRPAGVSVEQFRLRHGDQSVVREPTVIDISLTSTVIGHSGRRSLLGFLAESRAANGAELIAHGGSLKPPMTETEVQGAIDMLVWSGTVRKTSLNEVSFQESGYLL